jgi:orotate phosphoribosyltransferase
VSKQDFRHAFLEFVISRDILRFGEFKTKAGRLSPYFFNAGLFNDGEALHKLGQFYAQAILASGVQFDMLFGPAYKGIPLVAATAMSLAQNQHNVTFCYNRKEAKDHGEGGTLIGAPLKGRVLIIDDVISAGTSVRESVALIEGQGAKPCGVAIALDRMERGTGQLSAVQEVNQEYKIPVISIANLEDLLVFLEPRQELANYLLKIQQYRAEYGVSSL